LKCRRCRWLRRRRGVHSGALDNRPLAAVPPPPPPGRPLHRTNTLKVRDRVGNGPGSAIGRWMVTPGHGSQERVRRPGQPADSKLRVLPPNRLRTLLELVEELIEHHHLE